MSYKKTIQNAVEQYVNEVRKAKTEISKAKETYLPEIAKKVEKSVTEALKGKYDAAVQQIRAAAAEGERAAEAWGRMEGSKLTPDAELLKFDLSPKDFDDLVMRNRDNGTMMKVLYQYAEKKNADKPFTYDISGIVTPEQKAHMANAFGNSAVDLMDRNSLTEGYMKGVDSPMVKAAFDNFIALEDED